MNGCGEGLFHEVAAPLHTGTPGKMQRFLAARAPVLEQPSMEKHHRYNEGERKMAGDAGRRRRGKHQESVTLRANEKIKRHSTGRGGGGEKGGGDIR